MKFEEFAKKNIARKIFPGIAVLVGIKDRVVFEKHLGYKSTTPEVEPLEGDTLYDLASLTKPLLTAFLTVYLMENRHLNPGTGVKHFFPQLPFDARVSQLLTHTSGLPAWKPLYLQGEDYLEVFKSISPAYRLGSEVNYSCLGYILLYHVIEKVSGTSFRDLAHRVVIDRLNLRRTFLKVPHHLQKGAAPTEKGNVFEKKLAQKEWPESCNHFHWREHVIRGETHDGNAYYAGGCAGNSGLFSTTDDLFKLSLEFFPATATILEPESIRLFWHNFTPFKGSHRSFGFKLNSSLSRPGGRWLSRKAIGHNGFTGTSIWLEPGTETKMILLTNRVHPQVQDINFNKIRRKMHRLLKWDLDLHGR